MINIRTYDGITYLKLIKSTIYTGGFWNVIILIWDQVNCDITSESSLTQYSFWEIIIKIP